MDDLQAQSEQVQTTTTTQDTKNIDAILRIHHGGDGLSPIAPPSDFGITDANFKPFKGAQATKSGPGARGRNAGRINRSNTKQKSSSSLIPGASAYATQHQGFCRYHENQNLTCRDEGKGGVEPTSTPG